MDSPASSTPPSIATSSRPLGFFATLSDLGCHQRNIHGSGTPRNLAHLICYCFSYIPMLIALGLMFAVSIPYIVYFIYDYCYLMLYLTGRPYFFLYAVLMTVFTVGGMFVAYFRSIFTNPGFVDPVVWSDSLKVLCLDGVIRESRSGSMNNNVVVAKFEGFVPRWCKTCKIFKPDQSHHCSECGKCVLKLDHHCPWICNCVGERNHKYFLLFLLYIGASGAHMGSSIMFGHWFYSEKVKLPTHLSVAHFLISLVAAVFAVVLGFFGIFHIFLIGAEETTLERNIARLTGKIPHQQKISWVMRCFTLFTLKSLRQMIEPVMGDASPMWQWFLPCFSPKYISSGTTVPRDFTAIIMSRVAAMDNSSNGDAVDTACVVEMTKPATARAEIPKISVSDAEGSESKRDK